MLWKSEHDPIVVAYIYKPSMQGAKAGGLPQVWN